MTGVQTCALPISPEELLAKRQALATSIEQAEARLNAAADALALSETALRLAEENERRAERTASEAREARARSEALAEAAVFRVDAAADRILSEMELDPAALLETLEADRSEERRVGKECRSRWSPYQ